MTAIDRHFIADALGVTDDSLPEGDLPLDRFGARYLDFLRATYETEAFDAHPDYWTDLLLEALIQRKPGLALDAICAVLAACDDPEDLEIVAAGPLQELMDSHGTDLLTEIDDRANRAPRFRLALSMLWAEGGGPAMLKARIRAVAAEPEALDNDDLPPAVGLT